MRDRLKSTPLRPLLAAKAVALLVAGGVPGAGQAQSLSAHLTLSGPIAAPSGAATLCTRYAWACRSTGVGGLSSGALLDEARVLNRRINSRVRPLDDRVQYRIEEHWALPTARGGDCEDVALLKKQELIARGVPAENLLIATVFSRKIGPHAVLVLRLETGDFVLDNVTDRIKPWHRTGYTFMRMQNPAAPETWVRVSTRG